MKTYKLQLKDGTFKSVTVNAWCYMDARLAADLLEDGAFPWYAEKKSGAQIATIQE